MTRQTMETTDTMLRLASCFLVTVLLGVAAPAEAATVDVDVDINAGQITGFPGVSQDITLDSIPSILLPFGTEAIHFRFTEMEHIELMTGSAGMSALLTYDNNLDLPGGAVDLNPVSLTDMNGDILFTLANNQLSSDQWTAGDDAPNVTHLFHDVLFEFENPLIGATTLENVVLVLRTTGSFSLIEVGVWQAATPEPHAITLAALSLLSLGMMRRRRRR